MKNYFARTVAFILDDKHPEETVSEQWWPRYGHIYSAEMVEGETVSTPTGKSWPIDRVTFVRWHQGTMYKTNKDGWPLALTGLSFEEAKQTDVYKLLYAC